MNSPNYNLEYIDNPTYMWEYYDEYLNKSKRNEDEEDLWKAVLDRALWDYMEFINTNEFEEIFNWFFNSKNEKVGSFKFICNVLSINPYNILKPLIKWTKDKMK